MAQAFDSGAFESSAFEVTGSSGIKSLAFGITESEVLSASLKRLGMSRVFAATIQEYINSSYSPPAVTPSVIKSASKTANATSLTINTGWSAPTAGNTIIIVVSGEVGSSGGNSTFTFPAGFTQIATSLYNSTGSQKVGVAYKVSAGTESTLAVSMSGSLTVMAAIAIEVSNLVTSNIRSTTGNNSFLSATLSLTHSPLGGNNNFYVYGVGDFNGYNLANALSYGSGFTEVTECAGDGIVKVGVAVKNDTALNGETVTATSAGNSPNLLSGVLVCFGDQATGPTFPLKRARAVNAGISETETLGINGGFVPSYVVTPNSYADGGSGSGWSNVSNSYGATDGTFASVYVGYGATAFSTPLFPTWSAISIPAFATITGVIIEVTAKWTGVYAQTGNLIIKDFTTGAMVAQLVTDTTTTYTIGTSTTTNGFGTTNLGFYGNDVTPSDGTLYIDSVRVKFYYTTSDTSVNGVLNATSYISEGGWTNPSNATGATNGVYATGATALGSALGLAGFGFSVPADSVIVGVEANIQMYCANDAFDKTAVVALEYNINSMSKTNAYTFNYPSASITAPFSQKVGGTYSTMGKSLTPAQVNSSNFGISIQTSAINATYVLTVDSASMAVFYKPLYGGGFYCQRSFGGAINQTQTWVLDLTKVGEPVWKLVDFDVAENMAYSAVVNRSIPIGYSTNESLAYTETLKRLRNESFLVGESEALALTTKRIRNVSLSVLEAESIVNSMVRSRKIAANLVESIVYSINTLVPPFTLMSFGIAEVESYVIAALRQRKIALSMSEIEALAVTTLARLKTVAPSIIETEVIAAPLKRARATSFSIAEIEALSSNIVRARKVASSIDELEVINAALSVARLKSLGFSLAEIEALAVAIKRTRNVQSSVAEVIADVMNVVRNRKVAPSIIETQAQATTMVRNRKVVLPLNESLVITSRLARLKLAALSLAEAFGYSFSAVKLKALTAAITEIEGFSFGALRRTRNVTEAINEVISFAGSLSRTKLVGLSLNEIEALTETLKRARAVQVALSEVETVNLSLARKKTIAASIAEVESISVNVAKLKMMSYVIQQTEGNSFWLARVRKAQFSMNELEAIQASFNRARAYVLPIGESENFSIDFGRLRSQVLVIAETQGLTTALSRVREVLQSISNVTGYTFELRKTIGEPNIIRVIVQWQEFVTEGPNQVLKNFSEELISYAKVSATVNVPAIGTSTVIVPASEVDTLFLGDETTILFVPNNTF